MGFLAVEQAQERISAALDAIDAAHDVLRGTSSDLVSNNFRVDVAERLETQDRVNRGLMYRFFGEIADPPDGSESVPIVRGMLWARLRVTPKEITRRFKLAARIRPRRSLTGQPIAPELPELANAVHAGTVGEDHIRAVCRALDVLPNCVSPADVADAERALVWHATKVDSGVVTKLGQRIADYLNPDGTFTDEDRARRRGLRLGPQGPDGMSRLEGLLDPEARAYFEAIDAAVRPGRHEPDSAQDDPEMRDDRTPAQRCHDAFTLGMETAIASGQLGLHRGHPVTVIVTTTLAELEQAAHAAAGASVPMPVPARTGGGSRLPMSDLIRMAAKAIHYLAVLTTTPSDHCISAAKNASPPPTSDSSATPATAAAPGPTASSPDITAKYTMHRTGRAAAKPTQTNYISGAATTTPWQAAGNYTPWSPTAADSDGPTATDHPRSTTPTTPTNSSAEIPTRPETKIARPQ
jgi:hypothetical protein